MNGCGTSPPATSAPCNWQVCPTYAWSSGVWDECDTSCGYSGTRRRLVQCRAVGASDDFVTLGDLLDSDNDNVTLLTTSARLEARAVERLIVKTDFGGTVCADEVYLPPLGRRPLERVRQDVRGRHENKTGVLREKGRPVGRNDPRVLRGRYAPAETVAAAAETAAAAAETAAAAVRADQRVLTAAAAAAVRAVPATAPPPSLEGRGPGVSSHAAASKAHDKGRGAATNMRGLRRLHRRSAVYERGVRHAGVPGLAPVGRVCVRRRRRPCVFR